MAGVRDKDGNPPTGHSILWGPESAARIARLDGLSSPPAPQQQPILRLRGGRAEPPLISTVYAEHNALRTELGREERIPVQMAFSVLQTRLDRHIYAYIRFFGAGTFATDRAFQPLREYREELRLSRTTGTGWMSVESYKEMCDELRWADEDVEEAIGEWDKETWDQRSRYRRSSAEERRILEEGRVARHEEGRVIIRSI